MSTGTRKTYKVNQESHTVNEKRPLIAIKIRTQSDIVLAHQHCYLLANQYTPMLSTTKRPRMVDGTYTLPLQLLRY